MNDLENGSSTPQSCSIDMGQNKFAGGDMEQGVSHFWGAGNSGVQSSSDAFSGSKSLRLTNDCAAHSVTGFTPGEILTVTSYYKSLPGSGWGSIGMDFFDSSWSEISENFVSLSPNSGYERVTFQGTPPAGTEHVSLWLCGGTMVFDDVEAR